MTFETVHCIWDYFDAPRSGIANYGGRPHHFASEWDERADWWKDTYSLALIDPETMQLASEQWAIWRRFAISLKAGEATLASHPRLPGVNPDFVALSARIDQRIAAIPRKAGSVRATFRVVSIADARYWGGREVEWQDVA